MRQSDPVSSDLLKKVNAIIEDATHQDFSNQKISAKCMINNLKT